MEKEIINDENDVPFDDSPVEESYMTYLVDFSRQEYEDLMRAAENENTAAVCFIKDAVIKRIWDLIPTIGYDEIENSDGSSVWLPPER